MSASTVKKSIRAYLKKGKINDEIAIELCNQLISNIKYLEKQLQYNLNHKSNYIEILFHSEDGEHFLNLNFDKYQFWELGGNEEDWIREVKSEINEKGETAHYAFDKIEFIGDQGTLIKFYEDIYEFKDENWITKSFQNFENDKVVLNINGNYTVSTLKDIGSFESRKPQFKEDLFSLKNNLSFDSSGIKNILFQEVGFSIKESFFDKIGYEGSIISKTNGLDKLIFWYNESIVREYSWIDNSPNKTDKHRYGNWNIKDSDSWANCINPSWIKFLKQEKANISKSELMPLQDYSELLSTSIKNQNLRIISFQHRHSIVFESIIEDRIFIDFYYESGHFQGNVTIELNSNEILEFQKDSDAFLNHYSKHISMNYSGYLKERNIDDFISNKQIMKLISDWNETNFKKE